jgi:chorismate synthase
MNSFGRIFKLTIFGESHGEFIGINIDGVKPGLDLSAKDFKQDLALRRPREKWTTKRKEEDEVNIISGLFNGKTTGAPLTLLIKNSDVNSHFYEENKFNPRPSHADFVAKIKYKGYNDYRGGGIFSGRLTAALVVAGTIAKKIIRNIFPRILIKSEVIEVAGFPYPSEDALLALKQAYDEQDSLGGIVKTEIKNCPAGLGEPFFDSFESNLSHLLFSIPGLKAVSFGSGIESSKMKGSIFNDIYINKDGKTLTNNTGGINGGITNGNEIFFTSYFRPASSIKKSQQTINIKTNEKVEISFNGRYDICYVLRTPIIVQAVTSIVLLDFIYINNSFLY